MQVFSFRALFILSCCIVPMSYAAKSLITDNQQEVMFGQELNNNIVIDYNKPAIAFDWPNLYGRALLKFKPESFLARNVNLLNNNIPADRTLFSRHTIDVNFDLIYGRQCYGFDAAEFFVTLRNKATWGNPESIAQTTETETKILESLQPPHKHFITKHVIWIREIWLKFDIATALGLTFKNNHYFMLGAFPFELGRGIALGSAYAVNPGVLGFFSDNSIDQFAYGFKFSGDIICDSLAYDIYLAILENKGDSFSNTGAKIFGQEFKRRFHQERGSGHIDYVAAVRFKWNPISTSQSLVSLEPYALFNNVPEQKIEFLADASAKLGTIGLAGEFREGCFEWGFDGAFNLGGQHVKGWDRNRIDQENRAGVFTLINTRVLDNATDQKIIYDPSSVTGRDIKRAIETSAQDQSQNGLIIGTVDGVTLRNDINRFTNPYDNHFTGWMCVGDAAYWAYDKQLRFAIMGGVATGDENPNKDLEDPNESNLDKEFGGFIPLQEMYTGDRVQSALVLGPSKIPRPLSTPTSLDVVDALPSVVSGFTNLVLLGGSVLWTPKCYPRKFNIKPNLLFFWQEHPTKKFDILTKMSSKQDARRFLGTEANLFADVELMRDFRLFVVGAAFVPGSHYSDIKGKPLTKDQQRVLDLLDVTGVDTDSSPLLGNDTAFSINVGLEYRF